MLNDIMVYVRTLTAALARDEGQTLVEYALIIALVSVALVAALTALAGGISGAFNTVVGDL